MPVHTTSTMDLTSVDSKLAVNKWSTKLNNVKQLPSNGWKFIRENPRTIKRIIKCAVTLAGAIALTINHPLVDIWGRNPFLLGTTVKFHFLKI